MGTGVSYTLHPCPCPPPSFPSPPLCPCFHHLPLSPSFVLSFPCYSSFCSSSPSFPLLLLIFLLVTILPLSIKCYVMWPPVQPPFILTVHFHSSPIKEIMHKSDSNMYILCITNAVVLLFIINIPLIPIFSEEIQHISVL